MERNGMAIPAAIKLNGYEKHFDGFDLGPLELEIPAGFTTASKGAIVILPLTSGTMSRCSIGSTVPEPVMLF